MKKYKLIREYPGSPKIGHIIKEYSEKHLVNYYHSVKEDENCISLTMYHHDDISNYPEFWEEINIKINKPLFTTRDNVDIYKGDKYFYVDIFESYLLHEFIAEDERCCKDSKNVFRFSTKEAADEYIRLNKQK